jgi:hypothetical protein
VVGSEEYYVNPATDSLALTNGLASQLFLQLAQIKNLDMQVLSKLYMADMAVRHSPGGGNSGGTTDVLLFLEECFNLGQIKMASTLMWTNITRRNSQNISSQSLNPPPPLPA